DGRVDVPHLVLSGGLKADVRLGRVYAESRTAPAELPYQVVPRRLSMWRRWTRDVHLPAGDAQATSAGDAASVCRISAAQLVMNGFVQMNAGTISPAEFPSPENISQIIAAAQTQALPVSSRSERAATP